jgi:hypothetical protein
MFDIIGDIHGHADELVALLQNLGYTDNDGCYRHPERQVVFLGDFIDRGPKVREVLALVRPMIEMGAALAVMGNHEFNFLCYNAKNETGNWIRAHSEDNVRQVASTVKAFQGRESELKDYLDWFYTLPIFLDFGEFRVAHACWRPDEIAQLKTRFPDGRLNKETLPECGTKGTALYDAIEVVLKGMEVLVDFEYRDKDGKLRSEARVKWWKNPLNLTKGEYIFGSDGDEQALDSSMTKLWYYPESEKPLFVGHYWKTGTLELESSNVCCVDYSVAKNGKLVAYRWNGSELNVNRFEIVQSRME